jgi:hypothetical protein
MSIETFISPQLNKLTEKVNEWLDTHPSIVIHDIQYQCTFMDRPATYPNGSKYSVMIWYEREKD